MIKRIGILVLCFFPLYACGEKNGRKRTDPQHVKLEVQSPFEGRIIFQSNMDGDNEIYLMTKKEVIRLTDNSWDDIHPVWSPDGKTVAFAANPDRNYDIFVMNSDGTGIARVTSSEDDETYPSWFPDGKSLAFSRESKKFLRSEEALFRVNLETKRTVRLVPEFSKTHAIPHVSLTAPLITFTGKRMMGWDVAVYDMKKKEVRFLHDKGDSCRARFSRDGKKLAFVSSQADGKGDIWLMNSDGSQKTRLTALDDTYDYFPSWSPDGKYIVFNSSRQHDHNGDWALLVIDVETREIFPLFDSPGNDVFPDWY